MKKTTLRYLTLILCVTAVACSAKNPPISAMTKAGVAVQRAEASKATEAAPLEVRLAREKLDQAQKDMDQKNYVAAQRNAEEATVQAELAESKAKLTETKSKTTEAEKGLKTLETEINRGAK